MGFKIVDIYKVITTCNLMKLKDFLSKVVENKSNGQLNTCFKKGKLKEYGISKEELLNMKLDTKLNKLIWEV